MNVTYINKLNIIVLSLILLTACSKASADNNGNNDSTKEEEIKKADLDSYMNLPIRRLVDSLQLKNFYIGVANGYYHQDDLSYVIAKREFSYITPTNDFKQSTVHPTFDKWDWSRPDLLVRNCRNNKQVIRMHGPISPQCSPWVKDDNRTASQLTQMLNEYTIELYKRYNKSASLIQWMDVVNETIATSHISGGENYPDVEAGDWFSSRTGNDSWENPWTIIGYDESSEIKVPLYIDMAFKNADEYAPDIKHVINEHGQLEEIVWEKMKKLVKYLRNKGRRVGGLGWQCHIDAGWEKIPGNLERLDSIIKWCHENDLEFHVTEMNVWMKDQYNEDDQASTIGEILRVLLQNNETGVVTLNFWNIKDKDTPYDSWHGCVWDDNCAPRKAYTRIKEELIRRAKELI